MGEFQAAWENWGETLDWRPRNVFTPTSPTEIATVIGEANNQNRRIRVCGSGWSYSDVATSHDYMIELSKLSSVLAFFSAGTTWGHESAPSSPVLGVPVALRASVAGSPRLFAHVLAGMVLRDLVEALDEPDQDTVAPGQPLREKWALPTMGASAGQTLAGVVSTGAHGADFTLPPIVEMVRAIDLVAPDGRRHWFEPSAGAAITDPALLAQAFRNDPLPPVVHYDDDEFNAVLVSMGCMGVIHSLLIEVVPQFGISQRVGVGRWSAVKALIASGELFSQLPPWPGVQIDAHPLVVAADGTAAPATARAVEVIINPYRISDDYFTDVAPDRGCLVTSRAASPTFDPPLTSGWCPGLSSLEGFFDVNGFKEHDATGVRGFIDDVISHLRCATDGFPEAWSVTDTYGEDPWSVVNTNGRGKVHAVSVEFAASNAGLADLFFIDGMLAEFDAIVAANLDAKLAASFSLRYTLPSAALLAIQNFGGSALGPPAGTLVCHIEVPCFKHVNALGEPIYQEENAVGSRNRFELESSSAEHVEAFERLAVASGVHIHWGQMSLTDSHNPSQYAGFDTWQTLRHELAKTGTQAVNENRAFENDFTIRYGITATASDWDVVARALVPGSPTDMSPAGVSADDTPPLAFLNTLGLIEVLASTPDGNVSWTEQVGVDASLTRRAQEFFGWSWIQQEEPGNGASVLDLTFAGRVACALNRGNAHPEVFALNTFDNKIYHAWRDAVTDPSWHSWEELGGNETFASSPDVAMAGDENLVVVARRSDNQICYRDQNEILGVVGWNGWSQLPASPAGIAFAGDPCIGHNADGTLEVFARDGGGTVWRSAETSASSSASWTDWIQIGASRVIGDPAVALNEGSGALELFAAGFRGTLSHIRQSSPGDWSQSGDWSQIPTPNGAGINFRPSVAHQLGNLHVCAALTTGDIAHFDQNGGNWTSELLACRSPRGDVTSQSEPCLATNRDGRLEVFVKTQNDLVQSRAQGPSGTWSL